VGAYLEAGKPICDVVDERRLRVTAVLTQAEAAWITAQPFGVEARLLADPRRPIDLATDRVLPAGTRELPHEALGFQGGGSIETSPEESSGRLAKGEVFKGYFLALQPDGTPAPGPVGGPAGKPGERVALRFELSPKPLLSQWIDRLQKTLQGRAKV
jgi:putative peptide zinc metalloprotease protein